MPNLRIHINNEPLRKISVAKYLGMYIDQNLKWDEDINFMIPKISAKIGIIKSRRNSVPLETLKLMYNTTVQPYFDYANTVYDLTSELKKFRNQWVQTRAARPIIGSGLQDSRSYIYNGFGWLSLHSWTVNII